MGRGESPSSASSRRRGAATSAAADSVIEDLLCLCRTHADTELGTTPSQSPSGIFGSSSAASRAPPGPEAHPTPTPATPRGLRASLGARRAPGLRAHFFPMTFPSRRSVSSQVHLLRWHRESKGGFQQQSPGKRDQRPPLPSSPKRARTGEEPRRRGMGQQLGDAPRGTKDWSPRIRAPDRFTR